MSKYVLAYSLCNMDTARPVDFLNEIEIAFNGTFMGMHHGLRIYFVWNPRLKAIETAS